jgi:hypothetical protein
MAVVHIDDYCIICNSDEIFSDWVAMYSAFTHDEKDVEVLAKPAYQQMLVEHHSDDTATTIRINNERQVKELLDRYGMSDCHPMQSPMTHGLQLNRGSDPNPQYPFRAIVGSLLWLSRCSIFSIYFATIYLAQFSTCAVDEHWTAAMHVLRYLRGLPSLDLVYTSLKSNVVTKLRLELFTDSDWAADRHDRKSISGYVLYLNGMLIDWLARKQHVVSTSSTEAEFIALVDGIKDLLFVVQLLEEFFDVELPVNVYLDNQGAQAMAEHNLNNQRSKHIDIKYRFISDWVNKGLIKLHYVPSKLNRADVLTKALRPAEHVQRMRLFAQPFTPADLEGVNLNHFARCFGLIA